jgi:polysaccharide deacetylase family protein (PEP-CTERM system associated)
LIPRTSSVSETTSSPTANTIPAATSIDVEDWFQVAKLKAVFARDTWDRRELRVERITERMLQIMRDRGVRRTCFILGWVARKCPALVRRLADEGRWIACHGCGHELVSSLSREAFAQDIRRGAAALLEDVAGVKVGGYRAPSFSITDWAIDVLRELGYEYDGSAFPTIAHDRYGRMEGVRAGLPISEIRPGFIVMCISCVRVGARAVA